MSLKPSRIRRILDQKRENFSSFDRKTLQQLQRYRSALADLAALSPEDLDSKLSTADGDVGALPLEALESSDHCVQHCNLVWKNREQSLSWVRDRLTGIATFAV
ncbi:MAG TPA: hypothetical protein V6D20_16405, partial [Candidatus Obscuribacterales bacterium]